MKDKLEVIHQECGNIVYYCTDRKYDMNEVPKSIDFFRPDGTQCEPNEIVRCSKCNVSVNLVLNEAKNKITADTALTL